MFARTAKPEPVMEVALAFVDAVNRQDLMELGKLMSKNHMFVDSLGVLVEGRDKMLAGWADYLQTVPDFMVSIEETYTSGPVVVMLGVARGNQWQTPAAWRATVLNGQVTEWRVYGDSAALRKLMGQNALP